jgi:hypothetical protein
LDARFLVNPYAGFIHAESTDKRFADFIVVMYQPIAEQLQQRAFESLAFRIGIWHLKSIRKWRYDVIVCQPAS